MASGQNTTGKTATRPWTYFICSLTVILLYFWANADPNAYPNAASQSLIPSTGNFDDMADLEDGILVSSNLTRRDEYSCNARKPCSNGACCGKSGYCGYGPTYCGNGCVSNCDAVAECGQYAKESKCPLNVCCSKYGFCGTTEEFCGNGCQSNCVLHPKPPAGEAPVDVLHNKVIGYFEAWSARKDCHKIAPADLPVDALTHVNFAFAYIDPKSLEVTTMDSATPSSLFQDTTKLKSIKPDLMVYVSIGGWTFSDNDTVTQPIFGDIAVDASKRKTFANNLVHFMKQYGFDGVDIDWEYPAAPDRGGRPEDKENFVELMKTLRETFDSSGNKFGLTFTTPTSYWYLRWFDLPRLVKYADWINMMSYDLHGVWDASNPIGSIVQGHTNLTEIKLAVDLFWRVNIPPAKIAMGFGFYGRSFTLANTSCTEPGCAFKAAAKPGRCTDTGGILAHYEIQDILHGATNQKRDAITPIHDKKGAVNYFVFDNDQWVSYDDAVTFKQKTDWANSVGLGGTMIWASDLDDDKYSAHAGLIGREVVSNQVFQAVENVYSNPQSVIIDLSGDNGQGCFVSTGHCQDLNDNQALQDECGAGFTVVGWDDAGCGKKSCHCGKPICCPTRSAPKNCEWRGDHTGKHDLSSDCNGQCYPGETNIAGIRSSWGGGFLNDGNTNKCGRGYKIFCCKSPNFNAITRGCGYAPCRAKCPSGTTSLFSKVNACYFGTRQYCCPTPSDLTACHWVTNNKKLAADGDCSLAHCNATELEIDRDTYGGGDPGCDWGRKKAACRTVIKTPPPIAYCASNLCTKIPGFCSNPDDDESTHKLRSDDLDSIQRRGGQKDYLQGWGDNRPGARITSLPYLRLVQLFATRGQNFLRALFRSRPSPCEDVSIEEVRISLDQEMTALALQGYEAEHIVDRVVITFFILVTSRLNDNRGKLYSGQPTNPPLAPIPRHFWLHQLHQPFPALGDRAPIAPGLNKWDRPDARIMECFGSDDYLYPFTAASREINGAKGRIMQGNNPVRDVDFETLINNAIHLDTDQAVGDLLTALRSVFQVFDYLNTPDAAQRFNNFLQVERVQLDYIQQDVIAPSTASNVYQGDPAYDPNSPLHPDIVAWWDQWAPDFFVFIANRARRWVRDAIDQITRAYETHERARGREPEEEGYLLRHTEEVLGALAQLTIDLDRIQFPASNGMQFPQPPGGAGGGGGSKVRGEGFFWQYNDLVGSGMNV